MSWISTYWYKSILRNFDSFEIEGIDSGNEIYREDEMKDEIKDKNFDKMIKQSVIVGDFKKRENYLDLYKRMSEFTISSVLGRIFAYLILGIYCSFYFQKKLMFFIIVIPLFILIDKVLGRFFDCCFKVRERK